MTGRRRGCFYMLTFATCPFFPDGARLFFYVFSDAKRRASAVFAFSPSTPREGSDDCSVMRPVD